MVLRFARTSGWSEFKTWSRSVDTVVRESGMDAPSPSWPVVPPCRDTNLGPSRPWGLMVAVVSACNRPAKRGSIDRRIKEKPLRDSTLSTEPTRAPLSSTQAPVLSSP